MLWVVEESSKIVTVLLISFYIIFNCLWISICWCYWYEMMLMIYIRFWTWWFLYCFMVIHLRVFGIWYSYELLMDNLRRGRIRGDFLLTKRLRLRLFREVIMSSLGKKTWGCHDVTAWLTQGNTNVKQRYTIFWFSILKTYMYYVFTCIRIIKEHWWSLASPWPDDVWRWFSSKLEMFWI